MKFGIAIVYIIITQDSSVLGEFFNLDLKLFC